MTSEKISKITIWQLKLPLKVPYVLSYNTFIEFEPIVAKVQLSNGKIGWGEAHISPGSSSETRSGGWNFVKSISKELIGTTPDLAITSILKSTPHSPVAKTSLAVAIEMATNYTSLITTEDIVFPLLTPFNATNPEAIETEIEERLALGFKTFKIKVGKDVEKDLRRVTAIQKGLSGRATLRLDANRAYSRSDALNFVKKLDAEQIELFEQPCNADDWNANADVARISPVPVMLDEPICSFSDIDRASTISNVGFCKLKLKRFSSIAQLERGLLRVKEHGMQAVLGDGLGADISCWMEACVGHRLVNNAGEFNGFLKTEKSILLKPLDFDNGAVHVPKDYWPDIDLDYIETLIIERASF